MRRLIISSGRYEVIWLKMLLGSPILPPGA
jgi:hypothetical protein